MLALIQCKTGEVYVMAFGGFAAEALASAPEHFDTIVQAEIACWCDAERAKVVSWRQITAEQVPTDPTFRDAWELGDGGIVVNMPKAREIHRDRLRAMRAPKLIALDFEFYRAMERRDTTAMDQVAAQKEALRDVTADPAIEAAQTPDELKNVLPKVLTSVASNDKSMLTDTDKR